MQRISKRLRCARASLSSRREGAWSTARLKIRDQVGGKIPEAGEASQDGPERAGEVVSPLPFDRQWTLQPTWWPSEFGCSDLQPCLSVSPESPNLAQRKMLLSKT